ncbi:MAG: hypothetical protein ACI9J3_003856 [Parvicellaceae bacterium]|jgi:hypothetical protein
MSPNNSFKASEVSFLYFHDGYELACKKGRKRELCPDDQMGNFDSFVGSVILDNQLNA